MTSENIFPQIKSVEREEFDRLTDYLRALDQDGWVEQSYCSDWLVYQAISHIGSGSRIGKLRLDAWCNGAPPVAREAMQEVWGLFDSLGPNDMLHEYLKASGEYLAAEHSLPDDAGLTEVEGFVGKRPLYVYQLGRLWELTAHAWDVYVARDCHAQLPANAVELLAARLDSQNLPVDKARADALGFGVQFDLKAPNHSYTLDLSGQRPRLKAGSDSNAALLLEAPAEEMVRFVQGRHFVPGSKPKLAVRKGSKDELAKVRAIFR